jgi:hypothetical protein
VPLTNAALAGTYFAFQFSATNTATPKAVATTGTLTADGSGGGTRTYQTNDTGAVSGPLTQPFTYDIASDGTLSLKPGLLVSARGGVTADGDAALLGLLAPNFNPGIYVLVRRAGLYDMASLSGAYHMALLTVAPSSGNTETFAGPVTFDGVGGASFTDIVHNLMGTQLTSSGSFTYVVAGDGASTATVGGGAFPGGVVAGGSLAIWGGSTTDLKNPALLVVVRAGASATVGTFQGDYWVISMTRRMPASGYTSGQGSATANGLGGLSMSRRLNAEGMGVLSPAGGTYTIEAGGKFSFHTGPHTLVGGISDDGRFAVAAGAIEPDENPTIYLFVRK